MKIGTLTAISKTGNIRYTGLNTNDATATVDDIVNTKTAYVNGEKITGTLTMNGTATVSDVVASKTFYNTNPQSKLTGTIASLGATTYTPTTTDQTITDKYLTGLQTIKGDANLIAENIKYGITMFNIIGTSALISNGTAYTAFDESNHIISAKIYGTTIYNSMLNGRNFLVSVEMQNDVTKIGNYSFYSCLLLELTSLPDSISTIGDSAFALCPKIALTNLPNSLTSIGTNGFAYCLLLAITELPSGIIELKSWSFGNCTALTTLWIPNTCVTIISTPFYACSPSLHIYCEAESKPVGWSANWNNYDSTHALTTTWNTTLEAYRAL